MLTFIHDGDTYVCETDELKTLKGATKMENKIDWKRKLTSRKFWAALAQFVTGLVIAFGGTQETAVQVTALIMSGAAVVAFIIGEGLVDAANVGTIDYTIPIEEVPPDEDGEG